MTFLILLLLFIIAMSVAPEFMAGLFYVLSIILLILIGAVFLLSLAVML